MNQVIGMVVGESTDDSTTGGAGFPPGRLAGFAVNLLAVFLQSPHVGLQIDGHQGDRFWIALVNPSLELLIQLVGDGDMGQGGPVVGTAASGGKTPPA